MNFTIGADPEFFIQDKHGNIRSIIGKLGGSKDNPKIIDDNGSFKVLEDNVAAEYNIPPTTERDHFIQHIMFPQIAIKAILGGEYDVSKAASHSFPDEELQHELAWLFGCEPDYNAHTRKINSPPYCEDRNFRSCGGHIHIGFDAQTKRDREELIRLMDKYIGIWSVMIDTDTQRKKLYGKAGAMRYKPYGAEYRTLSNFWIHDPNLIGEVYDRTKFAVERFYADERINRKMSQLLQQAINTNDTNLARIIS